MTNFYPSPPSFWQPAIYANRRGYLAKRSKIKRILRDFFTQEGFLEVETALIQTSPGNETHLHAFSTRWTAFGESPCEAFLHTSPEFAMKKLLSAGEKRIFQFAPVFRAREASPLHASEFSMLEWYRAHEDYTQLMADNMAIIRLAAAIGERKIVSWRGREADVEAEPERLSVSDAFMRYAGLELSDIFDNHDDYARVRALGVRLALGDNPSDVFSRVLSEKIEPNLGLGRATILDRYPISEAALARPCADDPLFAERFELYLCGVELANAFGELTDPQEQEARFIADMAKKAEIYGETYPIDADFIAALSFMPAASGAALGFDRLVMLATGAACLQDVQFTPWQDVDFRAKTEGA